MSFSDHAGPALLRALGWDEAWAEAAQAADPAGVHDPARVTRVDRGLFTVTGGRGVERVGACGHVLEISAADPAEAPCVGDWVLVRDWPDDRRTLEHVLPRRTCVLRAQVAGSSYGQALAANVTIAAVVVGLDQQPSMTKIERLVSLAWGSGAEPMVILTKADMALDADEVAADVADAVPGARVMVCSVVDGRGMGDLRDRLGVGTLVLLGSSGAGKSTLVNELVGADVLLTREIRADGRGRHTSVRRELVVLPAGGCVIDTPGIRGVGMAAGAEGLAATFSDVDELVGRCRFNDCSHDGEPGCAVAEAVADGTLSVRRLDSWRKLQREVAYMERRTDARKRQAELRVWKQRTKEHRHSPKRR